MGVKANKLSRHAYLLIAGRYGVGYSRCALIGTSRLQYARLCDVHQDAVIKGGCQDWTPTARAGQGPHLLAQRHARRGIHACAGSCFLLAEPDEVADKIML